MNDMKAKYYELYLNLDFQNTAGRIGNRIYFTLSARSRDRYLEMGSHSSVQLQLNRARLKPTTATQADSSDSNFGTARVS
ncbi:hypothetical protein RIR_jg8350.t1 [Rhizophagus irregularis DAOM 181602=DAOM 197198]|nr:hypothetical protein RIR_jg8350.t1 [Rhizophagus irregularis DAOM 181602=DAOM 197198]